MLVLCGTPLDLSIRAGTLRWSPRLLVLAQDCDDLTGHEDLIGPMWSWGVETATHAMRIIFGRVFDRYPKAKLLLGHMGEGLPYAL